ncbi:MAG: DUF2332 family protein [Hyphomicrobiales bacterium]|nr:DUF2332 family protein [Hyphomicrobiales bacterium]
MNDRIAAHFEAQAKACEALGSPFTARICRATISVLDARTETGKCILGWPGDPGADALSLRLAGGLHALVLSGADKELAAAYPPNEADDGRLRRTLAATLQRYDATLLRSMASPPQTNEIARSGMLLTGFLFVARKYDLPLAIREIGSSAGLNLNFDRFHYRYGPLEWGDEGSPVQLTPEPRGNPPPLGTTLSIANREGCDIAPVDLTDPARVLGLRSYIWADQTMRLERLDAAIRVAKQFPVRVVTADAAGFVKKGLTERVPGQAFILFHSIMWQYMPAATRSAIENSMHEAGTEATESSPLAWLRMEPSAPKARHATLSLTSWPGGETRHLADCDYHGRWIKWVAGSGAVQP